MQTTFFKQNCKTSPKRATRVVYNTKDLPLLDPWRQESPFVLFVCLGVIWGLFCGLVALLPQQQQQSKWIVAIADEQ